jgi:hypothetical protein
MGQSYKLPHYNRLSDFQGFSSPSTEVADLFWPRFKDIKATADGFAVVVFQGNGLIAQCKKTIDIMLKLCFIKCKITI